MLKIRKSEERGLTNLTWLRSFHTFSFGNFHDPNFERFGNLRVINEDYVNNGSGFESHPHKNMEILTYVIDGELEHKDSLGNGTVIYPGDFQRMSAGKGVVHSEFNHSTFEPVHFLQIWIIPKIPDIEPSYQQINLLSRMKNNILNLVVSPDENPDSLTINQDVFVYYGKFDEKTENIQKVNPKSWLQMIKGELIVNETVIAEGDGLAIIDENSINLKSNKYSEFILFDKL